MTQIPKPIAAVLNRLSPAEVKEVLRFALFLKTRAKIDIDQAWFWTREWQKKEREADRDLARGRYRDFRSPEEALGWLKKGKNRRR